MEKKNNKLLITIMAIIILVETGFIVWKMLPQKESVKDDPIVDKTEVKVIDAYRNIVTWLKDNVIYTVSIALPKIDLNTETVKKLNEKIYSQCYDDWFERGNFPSSYHVTYEYKIVDDILYIHSINTYGDDEGVPNAYYYYDIKNDKALTSNEIITKTKLNLDELKTSVKTKYSSIQTDEIYDYIKDIENDKNTLFGIYPSENNNFKVCVSNIAGESDFYTISITK